MILIPINLRDLAGDPASQTLRIKNKKKPVRLRKKEYLALQALFLSHGLPLSDDDLVEAMCGEGEMRCEKLAQVTISTLRKKIGPKAKQIIERARLLGYRINALQFV
jgi:DNA-binding response OmpR family regulator